GDKKAVRAAYFELSRTFHPDTMFRKNLGSYKQKMEAVFRKLTEAYETLGKKRTRDAYDEYLGLTAITSSAQRDLAGREGAARGERGRRGPRKNGPPRELATRSTPPGPPTDAAATPSASPATPPPASPATPPPSASPATPPPPASPATPRPSPPPTATT